MAHQAWRDKLIKPCVQSLNQRPVTPQFPAQESWIVCATLKSMPTGREITLLSNCSCTSKSQESSANSSHPKYFPVVSSFFYFVTIGFVPLCSWKMQEMLEWWIFSACSACLSQIQLQAYSSVCYKQHLKPKVMSTKNVFPFTNCTNLEVN